jgi:hypothetical protein
MRPSSVAANYAIAQPIQLQEVLAGVLREAIEALKRRRQRSSAMS